MGEHAGTSAAGETNEWPRECPGCGSQIRPGVQFCTSCGLRAEAGSGRRAPEPEGGGWRARPLRITGGVILVAGLAVGIVFAVHPFGPGNSAAARSVATPGTTSGASPAGRPASASSPASAPSATPSASVVPQPQAAANLAALLGQSGSERQAVSAAFNDAAQCGPTLSQDAQAFQTAAALHHQLLSELAELPGLAALPSAMTQDLNSAWRASANADSDYARWVQDQIANGCTPGSQSDSNYLAASAPNQQATTSKTAFVQLWNPLAQTYGLATYAQSDL